MPGGRPTKYNPKFCEQVIEMGKLGKSKAQMAAAFGLARCTLADWASIYPEFSDAIACARDLAMAWWEDQGQTGMWQSPEGLKLNPQLWSRSMAARFPDDYRENSKVEIGGQLEIKRLTDTELDEQLAAEMARSQAFGSAQEEASDVDAEPD